MKRRQTRIGAIHIPSTRFFVQRGNTAHILSYQSIPSASAKTTGHPAPPEGPEMPGGAPLPITVEAKRPSWQGTLAPDKAKAKLTERRPAIVAANTNGHPAA